MKRKLLITALALSLVFTACGKGGKSNSSENSKKDNRKYEMKINYDAEIPDFDFFAEHQTRDGEHLDNYYTGSNADKKRNEYTTMTFVPVFDDYYFNYSKIAIDYPVSVGKITSTSTDDLTMTYTTVKDKKEVKLKEYLKKIEYYNYIAYLTYVPSTVDGEALPADEILPAAKDMFDSKVIYSHTTEFATKDKELKIDSTQEYTNDWGMEGVVSLETISNSDKTYNFKAFSFNYADVSYVYMVLPKYQLVDLNYEQPAIDYELNNYTKAFDIIADTIRPAYYEGAQIQTLNKDNSTNIRVVDTKNNNTEITGINVHSFEVQNVIDKEKADYCAKFDILSKQNYQTNWNYGFDLSAVRMEEGLKNSESFTSKEFDEVESALYTVSGLVNIKLELDKEKGIDGIKITKGTTDKGYSYIQYVWDYGKFHYVIYAVDISEINSKIEESTKYNYMVFAGKAKTNKATKEDLKNSDDTGYFTFDKTNAAKDIDDILSHAVSTFEIAENERY